MKFISKYISKDPTTLYYQMTTALFALGFIILLAFFLDIYFKNNNILKDVLFNNSNISDRYSKINKQDNAVTNIDDNDDDEDDDNDDDDNDDDNDCDNGDNGNNGNDEFDNVVDNENSNENKLQDNNFIYI